MPTSRMFTTRNLGERESQLAAKTSFKFRNVSSAIRSIDQKLSSVRSPLEIKVDNQAIKVKNLQQLIIAMRSTRGDRKVALKMPVAVRIEINKYLYGDSFIKDVELGFGKHLETKYQEIETRIAQAMAAIMADRLSSLMQQLKDRTDNMMSNASTGFLDLVLLGIATLGVLYLVDRSAANPDEQWEAYESMSDQGKKHTQNFEDGMNALMSDKDDETDKDTGSIVEPGWPYIDGEQGTKLQLEVSNLVFKFASDMRAFELFFINKYAL